MIQSEVSVILSVLCRYEDENFEIWKSLYFEITGKKLDNCCWLDFNIFVVILYNLLNNGWALKIV